MSAGVSEVSESQGSGFSAQAGGGWLIHPSENLKKALHILCEVLWDVRSSGLPRLWEDCPCGPCGPGFLPSSQEQHSIQEPVSLNSLRFMHSHIAGVKVMSR